MLFGCEALVLKLELVNLVFLLNLLDFVLEVGFLLVLQGALILKTLVLRLDVALNFADVLLGFGLGALLEVLQELSVLLVDFLLLAFEILLSLLLHVQQLTKQRFVAVLLVLELCLLDEARVLEFQKHFLGCDQPIHLLSLVSELGVLLARDFLLFEFGLLLLLFEFLLGLGLQLLQLFLVALDGVLLLVDLALEHARRFEHVFVVDGDQLRALVHVLLEVVQAESPLLQRVVQVRDLVALAGVLLLLFNVEFRLVCHS